MCMAGLPRVSEVEVIASRTLRVVFTDGLVRELDFAGNLTGFLAEIDSDEAFAGVTVDRVAGTVSWPQGIDFDPDVLYGEVAAASPIVPRLIRQYRVEHSA